MNLLIYILDVLILVFKLVSSPLLFNTIGLHAPDGQKWKVAYNTWGFGSLRLTLESHVEIYELKMLLRKNRTKSSSGSLTPESEAAKINEFRSSLGPLNGAAALFCTDSCLRRYLRANNWKPKESCKMLMETIKWRGKFKPEEIKWEEIALEAETGKIYRASFCDREGRPVLVMRPSVQNTDRMEGQIKFLVYCMENAIMNLPPEQEQIVWLVDFKGWSMSMTPVTTVRETAHVLQDHYPERLAYAILYNPPKIFEVFWNVIKPFVDPKTQKKVKFIYNNEEESAKVMESLFELDQLESAFGGRSSVTFDIHKYATLMKEDENKFSSPYHQ